ncbi:MAG TPA: PEP/pyruvate-binding domain-containing protein [Pseudonocardia sp.]|uniref:PEP/pyruvate-binding domain-containing protein n=1 Tax=Pseudonocardia sp. TaxID=60912 RepID=UPI002B4B32DB|nr:PEP/pyruvate-binding domain-containing protein [Pseudonocardia sp.]HLU53963.1 PEP/pyruvate-binding domain-containing protein [Pseudonocardia sp.]
MTGEDVVVDLKALDAQALPRVGGKAANLGELIAAGFPVPPGFVVTTAAYRRVAAALEVPDPARAREVLANAEPPPEVDRAVRVAYTALGDGVPVAVRSSATAEDLPWASFAGQQDTFLNVVGADAVLDAVRRCWASLWTDRAVSYRETQGIDHRAVEIAVVVQRMVEARVAGVLFTADPVTGTRGRTVIDAAPGLGEAVVSGAVNPDHVVVDAEGVHVTPGDKAVQVRPLPGGGVEHVPVAAAEEPCLTEEQATALAAIGRRVEAHFGAPQDVEWAIDADGEPWLTQARPITTLHPLPTPAGEGLRVLFCASLAQGLTRPLTPMGVSGIRVITSTASELAFGVPVADPVTGPPAVRTAGGRLFIDITPALRSAPGRALLPRVLDLMESRSAVVLRRLCDDPRLAPTSTSWWPFLRRLARVLLRFRVPPLVLLALVRPAAARRHVERMGDRVRELTRAPAELTAEERLDHAIHVLRAAFPVMPRIVPAAGAGFLALGAARALAGRDLDESAVHEVLRSLPHNSTTEMDLRLWALARKLRGDPASAAALRDTPPAELARRYRDGTLPPALESGLAAFLLRHGHRAVAEIDLGVPRWSDDPAHVLGALANYLRLDDPRLAPDAVFARGAEAAEAAVTAVVDRVRARSRLRAPAVRFALGRARGLAGLREEHKDQLVRILSHARALLAGVGEELARRGLLASADDVFFLDLAEARAALAGADLRETVAARRADHDRELRRRHVPRVLLSDGTEPEAVAAPQDVAGALVGTAASAGTVTARARVVLDPAGAHLEPGEILVAPSTDPGWTPLFLTAGGLVMEMGGPNSHGAVVAREYGIPAVVGVADATSRIATGDEITVDGAAGFVRLPTG